MKQIVDGVLSWRKSTCQKAFASRRFKYSPLSRCTGSPPMDTKGHKVLILAGTGYSSTPLRLHFSACRCYVSDVRVNGALFSAPNVMIGIIIYHGLAWTKCSPTLPRLDILSRNFVKRLWDVLTAVRRRLLYWHSRHNLVVIFQEGKTWTPG